MNFTHFSGIFLFKKSTKADATFSVHRQRKIKQPGNSKGTKNICNNFFKADFSTNTCIPAPKSAAKSEIIIMTK